MSLVVLGLVGVIALAVAGAVAFARSSKRSFAEANVIVEGVDTGAPAEWAGAHSDEARLHRRIRDAVRALQTNAQLDGALAEARVRLEGEAVEIDRRLVAAAALPASVRDEPMKRVETAIVALEQAAADAAVGAELTDESVIGDTTQAITDRLTAVAEARAALDAEYPVADPVDVAEETIEPPEPSGEASAP